MISPRGDSTCPRWAASLPHPLLLGPGTCPPAPVPPQVHRQHRQRGESDQRRPREPRPGRRGQGLSPYPFISHGLLELPAIAPGEVEYARAAYPSSETRPLQGSALRR